MFQSFSVPLRTGGITIIFMSLVQFMYVDLAVMLLSKFVQCLRRLRDLHAEELRKTHETEKNPPSN